MRRCKHGDCIYPDCGRECGLTNEQLIIELKNRISQLKDRRREEKHSIQRLSRKLQLTDEELDIAESCPLGCVDCILSPEYLRRYWHDAWLEDGCPVMCERNDGEECYHYDNEDK